MADPACAHCGKPILPFTDKITVQDAAYHKAYWGHQGEETLMATRPKRPAEFAHPPKT